MSQAALRPLPCQGKTRHILPGVLSRRTFLQVAIGAPRMCRLPPTQDTLYMATSRPGRLSPQLLLHYGVMRATHTYVCHASIQCHPEC